MGNSFKDLIVWQESHHFVLEIYKLTQVFPHDERYGLTSQMRRAAVSIPANIVEGFGRSGKKDKVRFFNIAEGLIQECHYFLLLSKELNYHNNTKLIGDLNKIGKMLKGYIKRIKTNDQHAIH